ncbi:MAG: CARDB domain-containing protein [Caldilineaceae bacterium]
MTEQRLFKPWGQLAGLLGLSLVLMLLFTHSLWAQAAPTAGDAAPDLVVTEIRFLPDPGAGIKSDITPVIKNQGDANAGTIKFYIYVEPEQDPPTTTTTVDDQFTFGLGLAAGATFDGYTRTEWPFTQNNPQVCVLVDPDNQVAESNENNNLFCIKTSPDNDPPPDAYEPDDQCSAAKQILTNGTAQDHNLSHHEGGIADTDWVSFTVESGVQYTAKVIPKGQDAEKIGLELYSNCDSSGSFGSSAEVKFTAPETGVIYLKASHNDATYGNNHAYQLTVNRFSACSLYAEPNNSCSVPVDFPLSEKTQEHNFCQANDVDWIRFEVQAGGKYKVSATNVGSRADAKLSLFGDCTGGLSEPQLTFVAPTTGYYYLEVKNGDGNVFGADTEYKINIDELEKGCTQDRYENDNAIANAQPISIDSSKATHNICPKGDTDWIKIDATKGTTFTVETYNLGKAADTKLCLHNSNGEKLRCDRDSGAGLGSRLVFGEHEAGTYYFSVQHEDGEVAGEETSYDIHAISGLCQNDSMEPDNTPGAAKPIATDNTAQNHNACGPDDADWVSFNATANTDYVIETKKIGAEGDTLLELYDPNNNLIQRNDDFTKDVNSQIAFKPTQSGTYRVKTQLYNPTYYGAGTEYSISVRTGEPDKVEPDNPKTPQTNEDPAIPATAVRTLILFNRARIVELYGEQAAADLTAKLTALAQYKNSTLNIAVNGEIIRLDRNQRVNDAYVSWTSNSQNYQSVEKANAVANEIRQLVMTYLSERKGVQYLILVGDDRVLPFRRVPDNTPQQSESTYTFVSTNHPTGAAIKANYFLSDDFYATKEPIPHKGREVYVPDLTTGRLIESPDEMIKIINTFMSNPRRTVQNALVSGYDFVKDSAAEDCKSWRKELGEANVPCPIGENWSKAQLTGYQLRTDSPFLLQSINGHADHFREGIPAGGGGGDLRGSEIDAVVGLDLSGGLIYTLGCHGGLNVPPENSTEPIDLVQAFTRKGANYIGNTGYGWGYLYGIGLSEQVIQFFTAELKKGGPIGAALTKAKQQYYQLTRVNTPYDEKVMQEITFYGIPLFELQTQGSLGGDPFPGVEDNFQIGGSLGDDQVVISTTANFNFTGALSGDASILSTSSDDTFGDYMTFGDYSVAAPDQPVQPLYFRDISAANLSVRSGVVRSATVAKVEDNFDPTIATPDNEFTDNPESQIEPLADGSMPSWYPPVEVTAESVKDESLMSAQLGQYDPNTGQQRVFGSLQVELFYSTATDEVPPDITLVDGQYQKATGQVLVKIGATDDYGIQKVTIQYIEDDRQAFLALKTVDASFDANLQKWVGSFPGNENSVFYVTVVDRSGNRQTANNKGLNFRPVQARISTTTNLYLPLVMK